MTSETPPLSPLCALAVKWHALMLRLIAAMRYIRWLEEDGAPHTRARAEKLHACLHVALHEINAEIRRAAPAKPNSLGKVDAHAFAHLHLIRCLIAALILILQNMITHMAAAHAPPVWSQPAALRHARAEPGLPQPPRAPP